MKAKECWRKTNALWMIVVLLLAMIPVGEVRAENTYFTFYADNEEASLLLPITTGELPYNGAVHSWSYVVGPYICNLILNYNGYYGDVADDIFYDEGSNCQIIGTENIGSFFVEMHPSSYINAGDYNKVWLVINGKKYAFDEQGRVSLANVPTELVYTMGMASAKKEQTVKITSPKKTVAYSEGEIAEDDQHFLIKAKAKTALSYEVVQYPIPEARAYIKVSKTGKVTMKQNAPGGIYVVRVAAKENSRYDAAEGFVRIKVKGPKG